ncbi:MAG: hypothetical protein JWN14_3805 [Chthonomonadales bacterium]|nr:hypothetical protein [Chthonomonadales bacterium]
MAFDWTGYLTLADTLSKSQTDEAKLRAAISRAYYAAYMTARRYWESVGNSLHDSDSSHVQVSRAYERRNPVSEPDKLKAHVGNTLRQLREYRVSADYDDEFAYSDIARIAESTVILSRKTIANVEKLKGDPKASPRDRPF